MRIIKNYIFDIRSTALINVSSRLFCKTKPGCILCLYLQHRMGESGILASHNRLPIVLTKSKSCSVEYLHTRTLENGLPSPGITIQTVFSMNS